jgi:hypothetical protein
MESRLHDKDLVLLTSYHRSAERDQELLRHRSLLREVEEATVVEAHELEEFQATKAQEITSLQGELQEHEEEL